MKIKRILKTKLFPIALVAITLLLLLNITALAENSWTPVASMSTERKFFQSEVLDGKIYAIGGMGVDNNTLKSAEVYNPDNNTWTPLDDMNYPRTYFQTEVIDGKIYALGGYIGSGIINTVEVYNPDTNTWSNVARMSTARCHFQTVVLNGKIYAIGGIGGSQTSSVEVYDPTTDTWTPLAGMSTPRSEFTAGVIGDKIYVAGGVGSTYLSSAEVYDPVTNTWTPLDDMSVAHRMPQAEVLGGKLYVIGGYNSGGSQNPLSTVDIYDPSTGTWSTSNMNEARFHLQTKVINGEIYAIGGHNGSNTLSSVEVYDPDTNTWTLSSQMTSPRYLLQTEVFDGNIYAIGGCDNSSANIVLSSVERYTVTTTPDPTPNVPSNLTATAGDKQVTLNWTAATDAVSYNVYRSTTSGGPYTSIASGITATTYADTGLTNGTTYYYVVTAVNSSGTESTYSNEASATPTASATYNATLEITMVTGEIKEYSVTSTVVEDFIDWFYNRASVCPYYVFRKTADLGPYTNRTEYLAYDKISSFEVFEY